MTFWLSLRRLAYITLVITKHVRCSCVRDIVGPSAGNSFAAVVCSSFRA